MEQQWLSRDATNVAETIESNENECEKQMENQHAKQDELTHIRWRKSNKYHDEVAEVNEHNSGCVFAVVKIIDR